MLSYTALRNKFGVLTNNTDTTNLTNGDNWINDAQRLFISETNGDYTEATTTTTTVAAQQAYDLPYNYEKLNSVTVTVGNFRYPVTEVVSREEWDAIQINTDVQASEPQYFFIDAGQINFWPIPSTSSYTIRFNYKQMVRDLANADYTTGTVTLTNASAGVTGSGTTFTAAMVGRWLKGNVDNYWYKIDSFSSTTAITLDKLWQGTTGAGLAFTIGEMPIIPEPFHQSLVDYAVAEYWDVNGEPNRAVMYRRKWEDALVRGRVYAGNKTTSMVVDDGSEIDVVNPNLTIQL